MKTLFIIFLLILSTLLIQSQAFSYSKNSGKVSVSVSVNKTDKSDNKSADAKTNASVNKSVESVTSSSKDNTPISKTAETGGKDKVSFFPSILAMYLRISLSCFFNLRFSSCGVSLW